MNDQWTIWTKASFTQYFAALAQTLSIGFSIDQMDSDAANTLSDYINLRVQNDITPIKSDEDRIVVGVEILLHYMKNPQDIYRDEYLKGKINVALSGCIPFMQTGYPGAPNTVLGFFQLQKVRNPIRSMALINKDQTSRVAEIVFTAPFEIIP